MAGARLGFVVPVMNQARYLRECLRSIVRQDYGDIEVVVVDGGSTDGSIDIVKEFSGLVAAHIVGEDSGQSDAINRGIRRMKVDYVSWLNADDFLLPRWAREVSRTLARGTRPDIISGSGVLVDEESRLIKFVRTSPQSGWMAKLGVFQFSQPALFYSSELWGSLGGLDENWHLSMDLDLWYRVFSRRVKVLHLDGFYGAFRVHAESKTSRSRSSRMGEGLFENDETPRVRARYSRPIPMPRLRFNRLVVRLWRFMRGDYLVSGLLTLRHHGTSIAEYLAHAHGVEKWP